MSDIRISHVVNWLNLNLHYFQAFVLSQGIKSNLSLVLTGSLSMGKIQGWHKCPFWSWCSHLFTYAIFNLKSHGLLKMPSCRYILALLVLATFIYIKALLDAWPCMISYWCLDLWFTSMFLTKYDGLMFQASEVYSGSVWIIHRRRVTTEGCWVLTLIRYSCRSAQWSARANAPCW